ncbi:tRNA lysidine(34) synthetase TilS [Sphingomonas morindae]|uniref:tRNA(Ile)-lysidine synthase n=1 Tax=Sphingomonas morindae TaxID=1541170 RepID=A0ABY4X5X7_9SPHN|nr:tRNA lysidine(34) synthetase TilS [Sphingomonas morindae]USI72276.1 tRNA lysidine(34) synthetase TilS [Sphingomonas morindae]
MPSAAPDAALIARFAADLDALLPPDAALGLAVSGGPDSLALLLLAAAARPGRIAAMTVDHGLRAAAAEEAALVAALCAARGVPHHSARVRVEGSVQAGARTARYAALGAWASAEGRALVTAHHADDQAETLLMRLARGAGLAGLSGVRARRPLGPGPDAPLLVRPLLGWRKAELEAIVAAEGLVPVRDPSNADPRFDRSRARALLAATPWLDPRRLAAAAAHLAEEEAALARLADERYAVTRADDGGCAYRPDPIRALARRHLRRLLADEFGATPDGPALERALLALERGESLCCADILCRADAGLWRFRRAPVRRTS